MNPAALPITTPSTVSHGPVPHRSSNHSPSPAPNPTLMANTSPTVESRSKSAQFGPGFGIIVAYPQSKEYHLSSHLSMRNGLGEPDKKKTDPADRPAINQNKFAITTNRLTEL